VTTTDEQHEHLKRLADELSKRQFTARLVSRGNSQYLVVANPDYLDLNERIQCQQAADESWCFWWPWRQPIGSVDDLDSVAGKITAVLRTVESAR
jgi:hypothetical protein